MCVEHLAQRAHHLSGDGLMGRDTINYGGISEESWRMEYVAEIYFLFEIKI